jgi:hypothetical protein
MANSGGVNTTPVRSFYPTFGGPTSGEMGGPTPDRVDPTNAAPMGEVAQAMAVGASGSPLMWWVALLVMLVGLMFLVRYIGGEEAKSDFASIKPSVYNILIISFAAIIGINFFKVVFTRFKVPGLSTIVLST